MVTFILMPDPVQLSLGFTNRPHLVHINEATIYDIPTSIVELATRIKRNEIPNIVGAVVILKEKNEEGKYLISGYGYGFDVNRSAAIEMCESMKLTLMGVKHDAGQ